MSEVWGVQLPTTQKLVLLAMADHADDEGGNAYPSVSKLANKCGVSERAIQYALKQLRVAGYLEVQKAASQHYPTSYRVHPRGAESAGRKICGAQMDASRGANPDIQGCNGLHPNHPEPSEPSREGRKRPARRCPKDFTLTPERFEYAVGKGLTVAQVGTAFEKFQNHEFKTPRSDWDATWRNWAIGEAEKYANRPSPPPDTSRRNSLVPEHSRQNVPSYEETKARLAAQDEEMRRQALRDQARQLRAV